MMIKNKNINGILLLNKPLHLTSNAALQRVKRLFGAKKVGHTGSLDPLATGMLPLCFGEATKFSQYLLDADKYYKVVAKFGEKTTTGDAEGEVIEARPTQHLAIEKIQHAIERFVGDIQQIPPMFSALKHNGQPLYKLARQGIEVARPPRSVTIHELVICDDIDTGFFQSITPGYFASFFVHCSKGTYIRTLIEDMGELLGCGAHVVNLHRVAVAPYQQSAMVTIKELEDIVETKGQDALLSYLLPVESSIQHLPIVNLSTSSTFYIRTGNAVIAHHQLNDGLVRVYSNGSEFIGIGEILADGRVAPKRLVQFFATASSDKGTG